MFLDSQNSIIFRSEEKKNNMPRTHYTAADLERLSCNVKDVKTIITFRNEQLLNLFINEMQGQISDGMWENSRHTDWLWKSVIYRLGDETKVEVLNKWNVGKKSFPLVKELWDVVGYRLYGEKDETTAGYQTEKEVRAAWRELNLAIYNVTEIPYNTGIWLEKKKAEADYQKVVEDLRAQAEIEKIQAIGDHYGVYLDDENRKGYVSVDITIHSEKNTYSFKVNKVFWIRAGHLAEGLKAIKDLYNNPKDFKILSVY